MLQCNIPLQFSYLALGSHLRLCSTADIDLSLDESYIDGRGGQRRGWPKLDASEYGYDGTFQLESVDVYLLQLNIIMAFLYYA